MTFYILRARRKSTSIVFRDFRSGDFVDDALDGWESSESKWPDYILPCRQKGEMTRAPSDPRSFCRLIFGTINCSMPYSWIVHSLHGATQLDRDEDLTRLD